MEPLLTLKDVAALIRQSPAKVAVLVYSGDIPSLKIGRSRRVDPADLRQWIARRKAEEESASSTEGDG